MLFLQAFLKRLSQFTLCYTPDAWVVALVLTGIAFAMALGLTTFSLSQALIAWGKGFSSLHTFTMQMVLILLSGEVLARAPWVHQGVITLARKIPSSYTIPAVALFSMATAYLHWGISLIASGVLARSLHRINPRIPLALLLSTAYLGLGSTWHSGLSGSVPLLLATPGHFLEEETGVVPLMNTLFHPLNGVILLVLFLLLPYLAFLLQRYSTVEKGALLEPSLSLKGEEKVGNPEGSLGLKSPWIPKGVGTLGLLAVFSIFYQEGGRAFNLDTINLLFLFCGILLHPNLASFLAAFREGIHSTSGVILQFPFYAGIYGILKESGLSQVLAHFFVSLATPESFPLLIFFYTALMNYFIPSGGAKWIVEAPYLVAATEELKLPLDHLVFPYIWGDMVTNLIQPFWALPLLKMMDLEFRHILGYTGIYMLAILFVLVPVFLFWGFLGG